MRQIFMLLGVALLATAGFALGADAPGTGQPDASGSYRTGAGPSKSEATTEGRGSSLRSDKDARMPDADRNKEVIRRMLDQVFNRGNLEVVDELYSADYVDHSLEHAHLWAIGPNREGFKQLVRSVRTGLSDLKAELEMIVAEGDFVAARVHGVGIHTGLFMGVPATGKQIDVYDYHFWRMENGKIREHWNQYNTLEIMQQLGVIQKQMTPELPRPEKSDPALNAEKRELRSPRPSKNKQDKRSRPKQIKRSFEEQIRS